ncbi:MAG TPA: NYN domain-containing protein [Vicinamibacteria bacterium]|nr:NYN domain-containing protein [Vicinamibacteria bacterium]
MAQNGQQDEQRLALFIDFENIAIGVRDAHYRKFDVNLVLERLLDKGKLLVKKAYADWSRYSDYKRAFHEAAIELIEVPQKSIGGKNSADIRLVVDAMDMSFQKEHVNCFVIASGDSDFSPLVSKLKENNKYVIGLGVKNSTSDLLIENCDEFIFYEDLVRGQQRPLPVIANVPEKVQECFALLVDSILALQRENKEILWGSMVKETMKRKKPSFNETYYGFRTFSHLLEDAQRRGIVVLRRDQRSGSYIVEDLGSAASVAQAARAEAAAAVVPMRPAETVPAPGGASVASGSAEPSEANGGRPRRRRGRGRGRGRGTTAPGAYPDASSPAAEFDDHDEGDEEGPEGEDSAADGPEPGGSFAEPEAERGDSASARPQEAAPADQAPSHEKPSFSLFSWIRRESSSGPPPPPDKPDPEER